MDELLLIEAVERYLSGEMSPQEKAFFEEVRKNTPEVDQLVVEHTYFLHGLEKYQDLKQFRHTLHETETKLVEEGLISSPALSGKAKVVYLWNRYKRSIAVAASIAGFISIVSSGLLISFAKKYGNENYNVLVDKINQTNNEIRKIKHSSTLPTAPQKPEPKVDFRGTGFLIDGKGYLVTNAHVISRMKNIYVENNRGEYLSAAAVYTDSQCDLAILKITDTAFRTMPNPPYSIKRGNSELGEQFFTLGFPRNEIVYGEGYVSAKSGNDGDSLSYQLTVSANPGNSGGPVINRNGEIIGIITAKDSKADGVVYATKSRNIYKMIDQLKKADDNSPGIKIPTGTGLKGTDRVQQVKKMEEFVFMVVGN